jgi:hypothetical protein
MSRSFLLGEAALRCVALCANGRVHPYCNNRFWCRSEMILDCHFPCWLPRRVTWQGSHTIKAHLQFISPPTSRCIGSIQNENDILRFFRHSLRKGQLGFRGTEKNSPQASSSFFESDPKMSSLPSLFVFHTQLRNVPPGAVTQRLQRFALSDRSNSVGWRDVSPISRPLGDQEGPPFT